MMKTDQKKFFGKYDYGIEENQRRYNGSPTPPAFNLEAVSSLKLFLLKAAPMTSFKGICKGQNKQKLKLGPY